MQESKDVSRSLTPGGEPLVLRDERPRLHWRSRDLEFRLGLPGGKNTSVASGVWLVAAMAVTVAFYLVLSALPDSWWVDLFTQRGPVPYAIVVFTVWSLLMLLVKLHKVRHQAESLGELDIVPSDPDFVLSPGTVSRVMDRLHARCVDPGHFILFRRLEFALSNLRNIGRVSDVDEVLNSSADADADAAESSYTLLRGLVWAIPVLGFIGTVQGLSASLGSFGAVFQDASTFEQLKPALQEVTAGLATAFDTTLLGLLAALGVQMLLTAVRKREDDLLDAFSDYCRKHVVSRLRLSPFEAGQ